MKKIMLSFLFAGSGCLAMAQDYSKVTTMYSLKKYEDAKKEVDKMATDAKAKDKAETYLWQAAVNSELFKDSSLYVKYPDAADQAYSSLLTYQQKDPTLKTLKEAGAINSLQWLYLSSFNQGKKYFSESKWPEAFSNFKRAVDMSEFINNNGFSATKLALDTITVLYTGYAAQNSGKPDSANIYYQKLADLKIGGTEMEPMYEYMLTNLSKMNQPEKFTKYLAVAKELYPDKAGVWSQIEMSNMTSSSTLSQIIDKYKADAASGQMTEDQLITYAESFASPTKEQLASLDSSQQIQLKLTAAEAFAKAFNINPKGLYAFNAGVLTYNIFNTLDDKFFSLRGESASLKAQRAEVQKQQMGYADSALVWLEKGYEILKAKTNREKSESTSLNRTVDYLANLYMWKRDRSKGVAPKDYDKYDAKYNQYSDEHDKYKAM